MVEFKQIQIKMQADINKSKTFKNTILSKVNPLKNQVCLKIKGQNLRGSAISLFNLQPTYPQYIHTIPALTCYICTVKRPDHSF